MKAVLATINWTAVSALAGIISVPGGAIARWLGRKLDAIGEHLAHQDQRGNRMDRRMMRVETKLGLNPLPPED
jgi:hypothetical protein